MNTIIIDDDKDMLLLSKNIISSINNIKIIGEFYNSKDAYEFILKNHVDVIFVDVKMSGENGIEFARRVKEENKDMNIIFITRYKEYAYDAFDINAIDYILKPITKERIERAIQRIIERKPVYVSLQENKHKLYITCFGRVYIKNTAGNAVKINSTKSIEILLYLLMNHGKFVPKWSILEDIFQGMERKNAEIYLNSSIYKLRKCLEPYNMHNKIIFSNGNYMIDLSNIYVDFIEFEKRVSETKFINENNLEYAIETEKIYDGEIFGDKGLDWSSFERERFKELYSDFAKKLAVYLIEKNEINQALIILKRSVKWNQFDDEVHIIIMKVFAAKSDKKSLTKHFRHYISIMRKEMTPPSRNIINLYAQLKSSIE